MLTESLDTAKQATSKLNQPYPTPSRNSIPPIKTRQKKQGFKLYERRNIPKNGLMISLSMPNFVTNFGFSPRMIPEILSPSILDFPSLILSPVTPSIEDTFNKSSPSMGNSSEEDKAIAEKKFYLHPSPMSTPRGGSELQLLPLFLVTPPLVSGSSS
ncbi:hypothetical protein RJ640_022820 [Escallonia rubra]|uniref:Uncharacterized protein n=1 Tax=Escallonia rubra TaxID=112253 RepID=A0AA88QPG9_9ASTE|nr:hypothetical protein RJ640_022820 [Escallonia rubra]